VALVLIVGLALGAQQKPDPKVVFEEAQDALVKGRYAEAERGFREVLQMNPDPAAALANLGFVYMRTNRLDESIEAFTKSRKLAPHLTGIDLNLGLAYYRQRNFPKAIPRLVKQLVRSPVAGCSTIMRSRRLQV
jgi:Flp pilus assembly protein TadD